MRILVVGGMHGNEPLGLEVVKLFQNTQVQNVDVLRANEQAIAANARFTGQDLNRSFPGDAKAVAYEPQRAATLLQQCRNYDVVLDFHNTHCPQNDCGFVGETAGERLDQVAVQLGLSRLIVADYDCINKYAPNCISIEVSMDSQLNNPNLWFERIVALSKAAALTTKPQLDKYRFVYRMTLEDKERLDLPSKNLQAFTPLDAELARAMGVPSPAYPIFIGDGFTPYNYGGLLGKI